MIWHDGKFIFPVEYDTDALGNPISEDRVLGVYPCRLSTWNSTDTVTLGREYTESHRKMLTRAPADIIRQSHSVNVDGMTYEMGDHFGDDRARMRIVHLSAYKVSENGC